MNDALLDLIDDRDIVGTNLTVAELTGTPEERLWTLETPVARGPLLRGEAPR